MRQESTRWKGSLVLGEDKEVVRKEDTFWKPAGTDAQDPFDVVGRHATEDCYLIPDPTPNWQEINIHE